MYLERDLERTNRALLLILCSLDHRKLQNHVGTSADQALLGDCCSFTWGCAVSFVPASPSWWWQDARSAVLPQTEKHVTFRMWEMLFCRYMFFLGVLMCPVSQNTNDSVVACCISSFFSSSKGMQPSLTPACHVQESCAESVRQKPVRCLSLFLYFCFYGH